MRILPASSCPRDCVQTWMAMAATLATHSAHSDFFVPNRSMTAPAMRLPMALPVDVTYNDGGRKVGQGENTS